MTTLHPTQTICPECGQIATCEGVDVGVGWYLDNAFTCRCGWESEADGRMNVGAYADYFEEPHMTAIYFTQFLLPDGRKKIISIDRPDPVVSKADAIKRHGFRFECEVLTTGDVSLTISDDDQDHAIEVCANNEAVPATVDRLILNFDVAAALKRKELAS